MENRGLYITPEQYEIALKNGISNTCLYQRINKSGWNIERAITEKPQKQRRGLWYKWGHLATYNGISRQQFYDRICSKKMNMNCYEAATRPIKKTKLRG